METKSGKYVLWTIQIILAAMFLFSGVSKLMMSDADLTAQSDLLPALFLRMIGVFEILGSLGLVLPAALNIKSVLTPLAAIGLAIIMVGAVVVTTITMNVKVALIPLVFFLLTVFVAVKRWKIVASQNA